MPVSEELKKIVVCPKCKTPLLYNEQKDAFDCAKCRVRYPIEDGIANLLIDAAKDIDAHE